MLTGTGGNCGSQSSTLIIRGLATDEIEFRDIFKAVRKEVAVSLMVGVMLAIVNGIRIMLMYSGDFMLAVTLGITIICTVMLAKVIGCCLPLVAKKIGLDPALMAAPLITTLVDTGTIILYFTIATKIFGI
jgi:magnesium transporter